MEKESLTLLMGSAIVDDRTTFFLENCKTVTVAEDVLFLLKNLCKAHSKLEMVEEYAYELSALHIEVIKGR